MTEPVRVVWRRREPPLKAAAVVARGEAVAALARATARLLSAGAQLRVCSGDSWLLIIGETADLPWAENVSYLGWDDGVLVPATAACQPPAGLVRTSLLLSLPRERELVVLLGTDVLATTFPSRPADPAQLAAMA